jgi:hypothetical protein
MMVVQAVAEVPEARCEQPELYGRRVGDLIFATLVAMTIRPAGLVGRDEIDAYLRCALHDAGDPADPELRRLVLQSAAAHLLVPCLIAQGMQAGSDKATGIYLNSAARFQEASCKLALMIDRLRRGQSPGGRG